MKAWQAICFAFHMHPWVLRPYTHVMYNVILIQKSAYAAAMHKFIFLLFISVIVRIEGIGHHIYLSLRERDKKRLHASNEVQFLFEMNSQGAS